MPTALWSNNFNDIIGQLTMRQSFRVRSVLEQYEGFTAWESRDVQTTDNILKQFRNNLYKYEGNFKERKLPSDSLQKKDHLRKADKENEPKLPSLPKEGLNRKGSFLAFKNRNILKEAIENAQQLKRNHLIIHEMLIKPKKYDSKQLKQHRELREPKEPIEKRFSKKLGEGGQHGGDSMIGSRGATCYVKERKARAESINLRDSKSRGVQAEGRCWELQFSDWNLAHPSRLIQPEKLVSRHYRGRDKQRELIEFSL